MATTRPPAVARVLQRVTATIREHELTLPGQTVLVCVSGGPDSVCLLESLVRLRRLLRIRLAVFHLDHALREGSERDAAYVRRLAERHRLPFHLRAAPGRPPPGVSVEAWARGVRRAAAAEVAREADAARIATAHTRDDQAETVLLRLLTGSGSGGVAGIRHAAGPYVRPLLDVPRGDVEAFIRALRLRPRRDPTNDDPRFALRNALRLEGIPALERALGRGIREPLARAAVLLTADDAYLGRQVFAAWDDTVAETADGLDLDALRLLDLPPVIASRLVALALARCDVDATREDVVAILDLAGGRPGRRRDLSAGSTARRGRGYVHLSPRPSPEGADRGRGA
ncbi:MAG TPA: tRNA lysidine(34) synthetase TilS [Actinomycetota bacterium]